MLDFLFDFAFPILCAIFVWRYIVAKRQLWRMAAIRAQNVHLLKENRALQIANQDLCHRRMALLAELDRKDEQIQRLQEVELSRTLVDLRHTRGTRDAVLVGSKPTNGLDPDKSN